MSRKAKQAQDGDAAPGAGGSVVSIAGDARAVASIRQARARLAVAAFLLVGLLCLHKGVPAQTAVVRALASGMTAFLCAWAVGLLVWKQIVLAELRIAHAAREERRREQLEAAAARRAAAEAARAAAS